MRRQGAPGHLASRFRFCYRGVLPQLMRGSMTRLASGLIAVAALTGCTCGDLHVVIYEKGPGEPIRSWLVGDTASVWAEAGQEPSSPDIICPRYASRAALNYRGQLEPDSFTFQSSRPEVASVTTQGLVTALQAGQTDITATSSGAVSPILRITVRAPN